MSQVIALVGAGSIGQAIVRLVGSGKKLLLGDLDGDGVAKLAETFADAGFDATSSAIDVTSRASVEAFAEHAASLGDVAGLIHAAGVSPSSAPAEMILKVDLYGAALVLETFGPRMAAAGCGLVVSSQAGHRLAPLPEDTMRALATTPTDDLLHLPVLSPDRFATPLHAYQLAKRAVALRVMRESVRWGRRGARLNCLSPGIVMTPLARKELRGDSASTYRQMIERSSAKRAATPDEIGKVGAMLMGPDGAYITGSDLLVDGGVSANHWFGDLPLDW